MEATKIKIPLKGLFALLFLFFGCQKQPPVEEIGPTRISGTVSSLETGLPLDSVLIQIHPLGPHQTSLGAKYVVYTDEKGQYNLDTIFPDATQTIFFFGHPGYRTDAGPKHLVLGKANIVDVALDSVAPSGYLRVVFYNNDTITQDQPANNLGTDVFLYALIWPSENLSSWFFLANGEETEKIWPVYGNRLLPIRWGTYWSNATSFHSVSHYDSIYCQGGDTTVHLIEF